jgi:integrase
LQNFRANITKRHIKQKNREGKIFEYERYILHYNDPSTGKRRMERYDTRKDAEFAQNELIKNSDAMRRRKDGKTPTLREAVDHWLQSKKLSIQRGTHHAYTQVAYDFILGPAIKGTLYQKYRYALTKKLPEGIQRVDMLGGHRKIEEITTAEIRMWCQRVLSVSSTYNAKVAKKHLSSIFRLIEEDYEIRLARMPSRPGPTHRRKTRKLLTEAQMRLVLEEAQRDKKWGVYYAFLFLTGVRPSEMLGLLWENVDLNMGRILICRTQAYDGSLKDTPKTEAGVREIPLNSKLLAMLREWREVCPRHNGELRRVFPSQPNANGIGRKVAETSEGGMSLSNFRMRVWYPLFERLSLPQVSIYAARHMVLSYLQAQGVEIGLVAKIAGHSSPQVTLQYYTHAVRECAGLMDKLNTAYALDDKSVIEHISAKETQVQI